MSGLTWNQLQEWAEHEGGPHYRLATLGLTPKSAHVLAGMVKELEESALRGHRMALQLRDGHVAVFEDCEDGFCPDYRAALATFVELKEDA